jgi:hypothetical protein
VERVEIGVTKAVFGGKIHLDSVIKLQNLKKGGIMGILTETQKDRKLSAQVTEGKKTNAYM